MKTAYPVDRALATVQWRRLADPGARRRALPFTRSGRARSARSGHRLLSAARPRISVTD
jgi:hypothetical protein